jgi:chromosome segregation ATPase
MNVKKIITGGIIAVALAAAAVFISDYRGKSILIGELNRQLSSFDREHGERQRSLEANLEDIGGVTEDAIAALEGAGAVVERTGRELQSATADLRSAKAILGNIAIQIRDLQSELDNCRAGLYRIRGMAGVDAGGEVKHPP